ncbi:MAG TPA: NADH-quinone oxidoreductase subunit M [Gemmataceae bacterium]|nr:NADH-quinone oxidoreductase subunit M [Gemmataceae bacterium]
MPTVPIETLRALMVALLALPAAAAVVVALLGPRRGPAIRWLSLGTTVATLVIAVILSASFYEIRGRHKERVEKEPKDSPTVNTFRPEFVPGATEEFPHETTWNLIQFKKRPDLGPEAAKDHLSKFYAIQFYIGLDGINVWLLLLTAVLLVPSVLISWTAIEERVNEYYAWLLALGTAMLGVFVAFDIILFYVFFELTLVPLFFLIGIWGGTEKRRAARKFFIYTLAGSLITLLGVLAVVLVQHEKGEGHPLNFSIPELVRYVNQTLLDDAPGDRAFWQSFQFWVFLALIAGFAIKVPLVPVHTWLPLAHTEAPTAGSVLLAGVLLKIGAYGFLRLCLPLAPDACIQVGVPLIGTLAVIGIIYGALCAGAQDDIKKLVAYSSVSHLGFCLLGMFAFNQAGLAGSLLQMINHGLSTGALFLIVGMLYERYHTRQISAYGGMGARLGVLTACMVFICLSSIGLPGLNGFVGEALVFLGMYQKEPGLAILGTAGIVLGAWYLLSMVRLVFFGPVKEPPYAEHGPRGDLNGREAAALVPIMVLCVVLGVFPQPVLDTSKADLQLVAETIARRQPPRTAPAAPVGLKGTESPRVATRGLETRGD